MPAVTVSCDPVIVVDSMEFRRALVAHFLKDWAAAEKVELLSLSPDHAHQALREGIACRMIIFNAGVASCSSAETLAEIKVLRALAPSSSLVVVADEEISEDVVAVMQSGATMLRAVARVSRGNSNAPVCGSDVAARRCRSGHTASGRPPEGLSEGALPLRLRGPSPEVFFAGRNTLGRAGWTAPTPPGHGPHHYVLEIFPLDDTRLAAGEGISAAERAAELMGLGALFGVYERV